MKKRITALLASTALLLLAPAGAAVAGGHDGSDACDGLGTASLNASTQGYANGISQAEGENDCGGLVPPEPEA